MTVDEFVGRIRHGERIHCFNIQERNQCLILLDELGFEIYNFDNHLEETQSGYLYPGIDLADDNDNEIVCWCGLPIPCIEYKDVPFNEHYNTRECTKEEFDKDFELLMRGCRYGR